MPSSAPAEAIRIMSLFLNLFAGNNIVLGCLDLDAITGGRDEDDVEFIRIPFNHAHPATPNLRRRYPGDDDYGFCETHPNDVYFHGTTLRYFQRICSARRLIRGTRPIVNKYGVNLTKKMKIALRYTLPINENGMRLLFEAKSYLFKSTRCKENIVCKEYWVELKAVRIIWSHAQDANYCSAEAHLEPLPMLVPIPNSLFFYQFRCAFA